MTPALGMANSPETVAKLLKLGRGPFAARQEVATGAGIFSCTTNMATGVPSTDVDVTPRLVQIIPASRPSEAAQSYGMSPFIERWPPMGGRSRARTTEPENWRARFNFRRRSA